LTKNEQKNKVMPLPVHKSDQSQKGTVGWRRQFSGETKENPKILEKAQRRDGKKMSIEKMQILKGLVRSGRTRKLAVERGARSSQESSAIGRAPAKLGRVAGETT